MDHAKANDKHGSGETDRIIAAELERLLGSPLFVRSPVLSRLLQFLVEHRLRGDEGEQAFYGAYFRDLDGNKLCAFRIGPA